MSAFFKKSALADKADKLWSESKNDFSANHTTSHVTLEKKTLGDVHSKSSPHKAAEKEQEEQTTSSSFVFGSNIADRIVKGEGGDEAKNGKDEKQLSATELFQQAAQQEEKSGTSNFRQEAEKEAERVKEAEKQHASTSVVEVTTGEESDTIVFQASCKIWVFDKEKQAYTEKGVCTLRINKRLENGLVHHRIVGRTSGTLRVVINTKIFADMLLERPDKRIRISAISPDTSVVQIFLLKMGFSKADTGAEADQFYSLMSDLLKLEKGEQSRKRKADCDLNADSVKIRDNNSDDADDGEKDKVDEGFVIVERPEEAAGPAPAPDEAAPEVPEESPAAPEVPDLPDYEEQ